MKKTVINGLEGCSKSTNKFAELLKVTTPDTPVVFAFKNYKLMREQIKSWSERFDEPLSSFSINGFNQDYQEALDSYTNKDASWLIASSVKFIFVSQSLLQKNKVRDLTFERKIKGLGRPVISHVVIDEFDFLVGIVPTLDYFVNHSPDKELKEALSQKICDYLFKNYTREDVYRFQSSTTEKFHMAYWLEAIECDITILTSEILPTIFLEIIGFDVIDVGRKTFINECTVHIAHDELIGRNFFSKMNLNLAWNKLPFDVIISDCIASGYKDSSLLSVDVVPHVGARGSNAYRGLDILTVLSYIPQSAVTTILDCINFFITSSNRDGTLLPYFTYNEVEALFYRDRLCQAVGRVIGYRGSKDTHLLIHSDIYEKIIMMRDYNATIHGWADGKITLSERDEFFKNRNVKFNDLVMHRILNGIHLIPFDDAVWNFDFDGKNDIWEKINDANEKGTQKKRNTLNNLKALSCTNLNMYFEKDENSILWADEVKNVILLKQIKSITGKGDLQPKKVATFFGLEISIQRRNGKHTQQIKGLRIK